MPVRLSSFNSLLVALLAFTVCVGCYGEKDATDNSTVSSDAGDELEPKTGARVAMSKEAFVDFVAHESPGRPEDGFVLFLKLPGKLTPEQRSEKYAGPIDLALQKPSLAR